MMDLRGSDDRVFADTMTEGRRTNAASSEGVLRLENGKKPHGLLERR
jgi:hypothetical protein